MLEHFDIYKCRLAGYNYHNLEIVIFIHDQICSVYNYMGIDVLNDVDRIERKLKLEKLLWI